MADRIKGITVEIGGDATGLRDSIKGVEGELKSTQSSLKDVNKLLKLDPTNTELLKQKQQLLAGAVSETKEKLKALKDSEAQVQKQFEQGKVSQEQYNALKREIEETEISLKSFEEQAKSANKSMSQMGTSIDDFGKKSTDLGNKIMPVSTAAAGVSAAAIVIASSFEDAMAKVSTIADTTQVPLDDLQSSILDLSNETGIAATDIAENVYNAISAGQSTGDAVNFVSNATKLTKAGFTESSSAVDILTTCLNAYGLEASEVTNISDMLIQTQNLGKTTVDELASSMGKIIPTAKSNNVEMEQLCASYAVMTSNGIATAETTTYLNTMLNELGKSGSTASDAFAKGTQSIQDGGLTMAQAMEQGWSLTDVLSVLSIEAQESGVSISNMFSSSEAGKAATVLADNSTKLDEVITQMGDSAGSTQSAFEKLDTKSNQAKKSLNEVKNSGIELGQSVLETLTPAFDGLSKTISDITGWFTGLDSNTKQMIVTILLIVATLGPFLIVVGKIATGISSIITVIHTLGPVIAGAKTMFAAFNAVLAANPIILVIAAIVGLIAIFVTLYTKCEWFRDGVNDIIDGIVLFFKSAVDIVVKFFTEDIPKGFNKLVDDIVQMGQNIKQFFTNLKDWIVTKAKDIGSGIVDGFNSAIDFITSLPGKAFGWGKDFIQGLIDGIGSMIGAIGDAVGWVADKITSFLHFSRPDEGPLRDYETWMPDFVNGMAKGIEDNKGILKSKVAGLAEDMQLSMSNTIEGNSTELNPTFINNIYYDGKKIIKDTTKSVIKKITNDRADSNASKGVVPV